MQSEAVILGTFAVCVFLFLSNFHICGMLGDMFSSMLLGVFGSIGYVAPVLLFLGTIFYASNKGNIRAAVPSKPGSGPFSSPMYRDMRSWPGS